MDKYIRARMLADDPEEVDRRFNKPNPLTIPDCERHSGGGEFKLRAWQEKVIELMTHHQHGRFEMPYGAGVRTLLAKICAYTPKPVDNWPDYRVLIVARSHSVVKDLFHRCILAGLDVGLVDGRASSLDEQCRIVCCTAASLGRAHGPEYDMLLAYCPETLFTKQTFEVLVKLRAHRRYWFSYYPGPLSAVGGQEIDPGEQDVLTVLFGTWLLSKGLPKLVLEHEPVSNR